MAITLELIHGHDKRNPTRVLALATLTGDIALERTGFNPGPGKPKPSWTGANSTGGSKLVNVIYENAEFELRYYLNGSNTAEMFNLQTQVNLFFEEVGLYETKRQTAPCWLRFRFTGDGLENIQDPVFGQLNHYLRIRFAYVPEWPDSIWRNISGKLEGVVAKLTCDPFSEGVQQKLMTGGGHLEVTPYGVIVPESVTNLITNPSFGHATYDTNWQVNNSALKYSQETRTGYYRSGGGAVRLINTHASTAYVFYATLTITAATYWISCYVRNIDGSAVTSSDCTLVGQDASRTTTFVQVDGGPWYLARASFTGAAVSAGHGILVNAGKTVYVDDFQLALQGSNLIFPSYICAGNRIGCAWASTAHASNSSRPIAPYETVMSNEFTGEFTCDLWVTPYWTSAMGSGQIKVAWEYYSDANNLILVAFTPSTAVWTMTKILAGSSQAASSSAQTIAYNDKIKLTVTQDATTLRLYINGASAATITTPPYLPTGGQFSLGTDESASVPGNMAIDAPRVWRTPLTAAQVLALYTAELEIKSRTGGGIIGTAPYFWTKDGDSVVDAVNDTNRDNFAVVAGVMGDVTALTEWQIQLPTSTPPRAVYLGRKATDDNFDAALLYLDLSGTVDANSSGGAYKEDTGSGALYPTGSAVTVDLKIYQGRYQFIARFYVATNSVTVFPAFHLSAASITNSIVGDTVTVATNANLLLRDFGDLNIGYAEDRRAPASLVPYVQVQATTGSATIRTDFIQLLPYPCAYMIALDASVTIAAGDLLIINGREAYVRTTSTGAHLYTFEYRGSEPVDVVPGKYNTIYFLPGETGTQYDITDTGTFAVYVTPRWKLAGGLVA